MKKLIFTFILTLCSNFAIGQWKSFGKFNAGELFIDPGKIVKQGILMDVWYYVTFDVATQVAGQGKVQSVLFHSFQSCEQYSRTFASIANYAGPNLTGTVTAIKTNGSSFVFEEIIPNSMEEVVFKFACAKK